MCWSTGRVPMAQPPGSETRASPKRASSGPSTRIDARIVFTRSYGASRLVTRLASSATVASASTDCSAATPIVRSSLSMVVTSCRRGTFESSTGSAVRSAAQSSGRAAFLAPEMATSPARRRPPRMRSLSMERARARASGRVVSVFGGGQRLHRQRMNLLAHAIAKRLVDALVSGDAIRAFELGRDDGREEMSAVALDLDVLASQSVGNETLDVFGGGLGHRPMLARRESPHGSAVRRARASHRLAAASAASGSKGRHTRAHEASAYCAARAAFTAAINGRLATSARNSPAFFTAVAPAGVPCADQAACAKGAVRLAVAEMQPAKPSASELPSVASELWNTSKSATAFATARA